VILYFTGTWYRADVVIAPMFVPLISMEARPIELFGMLNRCDGSASWLAEKLLCVFHRC
jgi:hypothetical protein